MIVPISFILLFLFQFLCNSWEMVIVQSTVYAFKYVGLFHCTVQERSSGMCHHLLKKLDDNGAWFSLLMCCTQIL